MHPLLQLGEGGEGWVKNLRKVFAGGFRIFFFGGGGGGLYCWGGGYFVELRSRNFEVKIKKA